MAKMKDWSPHQIYWKIFLHLGFVYKQNIRFGPEFDKHIKAHVDYLNSKEV